MARPMPEVDPVTSATLPFKLMSNLLILRRRCRRARHVLQPSRRSRIGPRNRRDVHAAGRRRPSCNFEDRTGQRRAGLRRRRRRRIARLSSAAGRQPLRDRRRARPAARLLRAQLSSAAAAAVLSGGGGPTAQRAAPGKSTLDARRPGDVVAARSRIDRAALGRFFNAAGQPATSRPRWSLTTGGTQSGCGAAQSAMGPFYCPTDQNIYLDPTFFNELRSASGRRAISPWPM